MLDNADNPAALTAGDRPVNSGSGWLRPTRAGLVLVTSRVGDAQRWGPVARILRLDSLDQADGAQVLLDLAPGAGNRADAESLSDHLGGLPLALHQAGVVPGVPVRRRGDLRAIPAGAVGPVRGAAGPR